MAAFLLPERLEMTIDLLVNLPARNQSPAVFIANADALFPQLNTMATQMNAAATAMNLNSTTDTSTTSNSISPGSKTFTISSGKSFLGGMFLIIADTAAPSTNYMTGVVTSYSGTTLVVKVNAVVGSGTKTAWTISQSSTVSLIDKAIQEFRLSLTSATPVTTSDVSGATTLYCTPYKGNSIALYDGSAWNMYTSPEFSLALGTLTSGKPYDVFCYDNNGAPTLELLAWTNDTTRATALAYQDGVLVKSGAATRRYMGTFYTTSSTTTEDSDANRYLFNYYNRVIRKMKAVDTTDTWNYTLAAYRQANNSTANQLNFIIGVTEEVVTANVSSYATNSSSSVARYVAIGLDSTTAKATDCINAPSSGAAGDAHPTLAFYNGIPAVGKHYLAWLEYSNATGTTTWRGDNGATVSQSGIFGQIMA